MSAPPTSDQREAFETDGYLVVEDALSTDLVDCLIDRLATVIERRRQMERDGQPHHGRTQVEGANTRIFHILEDDPLFTELIDHPPIMPYVHALLNEHPHFHASDAYWETDPTPDRKPGWHIDGHDSGYRGLRPGIPHLQLKIAYFLSDMTEPDQGNLTLVPGSHRRNHDPDPDDLKTFDSIPDALQVCVPAGTAVMFHNAVWHTRGHFTKSDGKRLMLYFAYEHPWMLANDEHFSYSRAFYDQLSPERRPLFHGCVFEKGAQAFR
jgi:ectoine hydroxylase